MPSLSKEVPKFSVLIVDDDRWATKALAMTLVSSQKFHVLDPVHTGRDAVIAFNLHSPDIVLMDINMPGEINGIEATEKIISTDPEARVAILTTVAPGPGIARALEAGAMTAISKNINEDQLSDILFRLMRGQDPSLLRGIAKDIIIAGDTLPITLISHPKLSKREIQLLKLICEGYSYEEIADREYLALWTVKTHARNLREKLEANNLAQLVVRALQLNYFTP